MNEKIEEIILKLISHEINKKEAEKLIVKICDDELFKYKMMFNKWKSNQDDEA